MPFQLASSGTLIWVAETPDHSIPNGTSHNSPGRLKMQKIACNSATAPPAAIATFARGPSYASAKTPPTNVRRNGRDQNHGDDAAPVVTSMMITTKQISGAVFPK